MVTVTHEAEPKEEQKEPKEPKQSKAAGKQKKTRKPKPIEQLQEAEALLKKIEKAEREVQSCRFRQAEIKESYREAKGAYETAVEELRKLCRARSEKHPLFDAKNGKTKKASESNGNGEAQKSLLPSQDGNTDWRKLDIHELELPAKIETILRDLVAGTLGELSDKMVDMWWHQDVAGIGRAAADKISDAFEAFWKKHPEFCGANKTEPEAAATA